MPLYEYYCMTCDFTFEELSSLSESAKEETMPGLWEESASHSFGICYRIRCKWSPRDRGYASTAKTARFATAVYALFWGAVVLSHG